MGVSSIEGRKRGLGSRAQRRFKRLFFSSLPMGLYAGARKGGSSKEMDMGFGRIFTAGNVVQTGIGHGAIHLVAGRCLATGPGAMGLERSA